MQRLILSLCLFGASGPAFSAPTDLPLLTLNDLVYEGAFRLPGGGGGGVEYSQGPFVYNPAAHSIFMVGHDRHQEIAEFAVPGLSDSRTLSGLNTAAVRQSFTSILPRAPSNPQNLEEIRGMALFPGTQGRTALLTNWFEYYANDNPHDTQTTLVLPDAGNLAGSGVEGFFSLEGRTGHTGGWMSPVPAEWQPLLGGPYIAGMASGWPIISRLSVGPSAFAFDPADMVSNSPVPDTVPTVKLLDFTMENALVPDAQNQLYNRDGLNNLWTHLSKVAYGVIVPGTRTYLTIGSSGGHGQGVCYKGNRRESDGLLCPAPNGRDECAGFCAWDINDYYNHVWLWDVNDLVRIKEGSMAPHAARPYAYGAISVPFASNRALIGGGSYDPASGLLYLAITRADGAQPLVVAFRFNGASTAPAPVPARPRRLRTRS